VSLRARLVLALAVIVGIALLASGALLVGLTRSALIDRIDQELVALATSASRIERLDDLTETSADAGRRLAVLQLDSRGSVLASVPSGFADDPDPLPVLPTYADGIPSDAFDTVVTRTSADGSTAYRVITAQVDGGRRGRGSNAGEDAIVAVAAPLSTVDAVQQTLVRTMALVGVIALAAVLVLAWLVIRRGLLPLERMTRTAEEITTGDLSHRAGIPHDTSEVGRLGAAFDTMLDRVEASFGEQKAALDAKERSEEQLRRFVADASHELRTPLTAVRGYADLYHAGGLADPEAMDRAMDRIGTESRRMGSLVEDLLLLARLDQGRPLRRDPVDLSRVATDAVADARAVEPDRVVGDFIEPGVMVTGDEDRLRQVVGNLLANVRLHTPAGTPVEVVLHGDGATAELRVIDHGPGIDPVHAERVFDRFYRADASRSRERGGSGLGLSIVASLVHAQGGVVGHEPTPGGGATFLVRLPAA
jgi:two-component system, OmpR family, sensor kinase